jgi:hypothetical protein
MDYDLGAIAFFIEVAGEQFIDFCKDFFHDV